MTWMVYWCGRAQCIGHMPAVVRCIFYLIGKLYMHPVGFGPTIIPSTYFFVRGGIFISTKTYWPFSVLYMG